MMAGKDVKRVVTFSPKSGECAVCDKIGSLKCGRCQVDFYCGKEHQVQHWPHHRQSCGSIELHSSPELGRYVVATKKIPAGTILMREVPLVATPNWGPTENQALCVGCFMPPRLVRACAKCGWPVCGEPCSKKEIHQPECAAFQRAKFKLPRAKLAAWDSSLWSALAALRVTLALEDKARGDILRNLQSEHTPLENMLEDINKLVPAARMRLFMKDGELRQQCKQASEWVRDVARIGWLSPEDVRRGAGICYINSTGCAASSGRNVTGLFAGISMVQHSCRPNVETLVWQREADPHPMEGVASSMEYVLVASRDIAPGEHLGLAYQHSFLLGATKRRLEILNWNFLCKCDLCSDPSQRGLYLEGWCCSSCSDKKKKAFPVLIHDLDNSWSCSGCGDRGPLVATGDAAKQQAMGGLFASLLATTGGAGSAHVGANSPAGLMQGLLGSPSANGGADAAGTMDRSLARLMQGLTANGGGVRARGLANSPSRVMEGLMDVPSASALAEVRSLEERLEDLLGSTSQVPLKEWERFIADALWPRGPLHPTHSLVLQAKKAIVELDSADKLVATLTPAESRRVVKYGRDLLAVCDVVCPGVITFRQGILLVLSGLAAAQVQAQMNKTRLTGRQHKELEGLLDEWEELHTELLRGAVCPKPRKTTLANLEYIAATRNSACLRF